jgi:hypothetical protein
LTNLGIEPIRSDHDTQFFGCGVKSLDRWLEKEALPAHKGGLSRTWVSFDPDDEYRNVMGFFTLCPAVVTEKVRGSSGSRANGYPSFELCKLARHLDVGRSGHGEELIGFALLLTAQAAHMVGGRFLVVDPHVRDLDDVRAGELREFYRRYGFEDAEESNKMYVTIATINDWLDQP